MISIETEYAGFRFRSRLEARWAVFFDAAGIEYQYEPEGFRLPWRFQEGWHERSKPFHYLPDFWLPDLGMYAEVKGRWSEHDRIKAFNGMAALSEGGTDVLLLPDVFRQPRGMSNRPWRIVADGPDLLAVAWPDYPGAAAELIASDNDKNAINNCPDLLRGFRSNVTLPDWYLSAAREAQRARFEFGETPESVK